MTGVLSRADEAGANAAPDSAPNGTHGPEALNSSTAGFIVHRAGQIKHEFRREGREFTADMAEYVNVPLAGVATVLAFDELFGDVDRVHWIQHLRRPDDYAVFLHMSDHDRGFKDVTERDRLAESSGGNWEKIFVESTYQEHVLVPQHGLDEDEHEDHDDHHADGSFVEPAEHQVTRDAGDILHTGNAGVVILRSGQCRYAFRNEARDFAFDWARTVNEALAGYATVLLYEETFGKQDRIHWLIHLRELGDYRRIGELSRTDARYRDVLSGRRIAHAKGGGSWERTFVDGSIHDLVMAPLRRDSGPAF